MSFPNSHINLALARQKRLVAQDTKLKTLNTHLARARATLDQAQTRVSTLQGRVAPLPSSGLERALHSKDHATTNYSKALRNSISAIGTGTGRIGLLLPQSVAGIKQEFPGN